jgi:antitoxin PrlF
MDTLEIEATVTKRGQTTLPSAIRKVLKVTAAEDRIVYRVLKDGSVLLTKKESPGDPIIAAFLAFIATDIGNNLGSLRPVTPEWLTGLQQLVKGVNIELDAPLSEDDE